MQFVDIVVYIPLYRYPRSRPTPQHPDDPRTNISLGELFWVASCYLGHLENFLIDSFIFDA